MLRIYTTKEQFLFEGEDAVNVHNAIDAAGARGANWTIPIKLECGKSITFVLPNIIAFEYD